MKINQVYYTVVARHIYMQQTQQNYHDKVRRREREDWLIQLANREGAWPKRPYECFWSKVGVSRKSQGQLYACN